MILVSLRGDPAMSGKPWQGRLGQTLIPAIGRLSLRLYWSLLREGEILGRENLDRVLAQGRPAILCYWHEMHFMGARLLRDLQQRGMEVGVLVSPSADGELAARLAKPWVTETIRASSSRTGAEGLRQLHKVIVERRVSPLITSDGPRGPRHVFKPGAILLARATHAPLVPMAYAASRVWRLDSWDRFQIPRPLSRIVWAIGEPLQISADAKLKDLEPIQRQVEKTLDDLTRRAEAAAG